MLNGMVAIGDRKEPKVKMILDLGSEMLIDRSRVRSPYLRLLLAAVGQELLKGSPWVAVNKEVAAEYELSLQP